MKISNSLIMYISYESLGIYFWYNKVKTSINGFKCNIYRLLCNDYINDNKTYLCHIIPNAIENVHGIAIHWFCVNAVAWLILGNYATQDGNDCYLNINNRSGWFTCQWVLNVYLDMKKYENDYHYKAENIDLFYFAMLSLSNLQ